MPHPIHRRNPNRGPGLHANRDGLAAEEPLEIRVNGRAVSVTMRTPGGDAEDPDARVREDTELAAGFLLSEGVIAGPDDLASIAPCPRADDPDGNVLNVTLAPACDWDPDTLTRHVFASSSCGLCGKATIDAVHQRLDPVYAPAPVSADVICTLPDTLRTAQATFGRTGGLHAAGLVTRTGELLVAREDVGRHNAVDKVLGRALLDGLPCDDKLLMISGRASFEILQKALSARVPVVAAVSAPSSLAADFARDSGQTLVGFLRPPTFNVYAHPERICG